MTIPGARGTALLDYSTLLENYTPVLAGTWFQTGMTANSGQAYAYWNDEGYVGLAIATRDGITAYPADGVTVAQTDVVVDDNGWLLVGPLSNSPIQLRQDTTVDTGHIDTYDLTLAWIVVQWVGTLSGQFDITFDTLSYTATITDAMDTSEMETSIQGGLSGTGNSGQVRVTQPDSQTIMITGPVNTILTGGPGGTGIANDATDGNAPTVSVQYHAFGFPAPFASTFHVMGASLSEGHLFIRDSNAPSDVDGYFPYLQGWNEVAVTRFRDTGDNVDTPLVIAQGTNEVTYTWARTATEYRQGLAYMELHLIGQLTITGVTGVDTGDIVIDLGAELGLHLDSAYIVLGVVPIGHWGTDGSFADATAGEIGHIVTSDSLGQVKLLRPDGSTVGASGALNADDRISIDIRCLISNV